MKDETTIKLTVTLCKSACDKKKNLQANLSDISECCLEMYKLFWFVSKVELK